MVDEMQVRFERLKALAERLFAPGVQDYTPDWTPEFGQALTAIEDFLAEEKPHE